MLVRRPLEFDAAHFVVWFVEVVRTDSVLVAAQPLVDSRRVVVGPGDRVFELVDHVGDGVAEVFWSPHPGIST